MNPFSRYEALGQPNRPIILDDLETAVSETAECHPADISPSDEGFTELELLQNDSGLENGNTETSKNEPMAARAPCLSLERVSLHEAGDSDSVVVKKCGLPSSGQTVETVRSYHRNQEEDEGLHNHSIDENVEMAFDGNRQTLHAGAESSENGQRVAVEDEGPIHSPESFQMEVAAGDHIGRVSPDNVTRETCGSSVPSHKEDKKTIKEPNSEEVLIDTEKEKQTSEAEMKSWLLKRMQGPIEGEAL